PIRALTRRGCDRPTGRPLDPGDLGGRCCIKPSRRIYAAMFPAAAVTGAPFLGSTHYPALHYVRFCRSEAASVAALVVDLYEDPAVTDLGDGLMQQCLEDSLCSRSNSARPYI